MISRQRLIEYVQLTIDHYKEGGIKRLDKEERGVVRGLEMLMGIIHDFECELSQPPADLPWIPVSSGILPETGQQIFATCEQEGESDVMEIYYNSELLVPPWRMTAWMPAEPYKEGEKE